MRKFEHLVEHMADIINRYLDDFLPPKLALNMHAHVRILERGLLVQIEVL